MKTHIHVEWQYLKLRCNCRFKNFYVNLQFQSQSLPAHQVQGDNTATQASSDSSPVKRRRGRPRGTPNKPLLPDRTNTKSRCFFVFRQMWIKCWKYCKTIIFKEIKEEIDRCLWKNYLNGDIFIKQLQCTCIKIGM